MANQVSIPDEIFQNAINAIELGIEDYLLQKEDPRRLHSAVRNLFAGILLLFKSRLAELSENNDLSLIKAKLVPKIDSNGVLSWVGNGDKTIDLITIKNHFKHLNIKVEWKSIEELQNYRNNIEHYFDVDKPKANVIGGLIAKNFIVINDFIEKELDKEPQECFSDNIWETFLKEESIHSAEMEAKENNFDHFEWFSLPVRDLFFEHRCSACDSELIRMIQASNGSSKAKDAQFKCHSCSTYFSYDNFAQEIINDFCYSYEVANDLGRDLIGYCPSCQEESYWADGNICLLCGEKGPFYCSRCRDVVPIEELPVYEETGMCGYCAHMAEKYFEDDD